MKPHAPPRRIRRALAWCAGALVGLELAWLLAANLVLALHVIPRAIAHHSLNVALDYERAVSLYPGDLRVERFWLRGRDRRHVEWQFTVESGRANVVLLPLLLRRFQTRWLHARGVTARFRKLESPESLARDQRIIALSPPIAGFGPIARAPYGPEDNPLHPTRKRWTVDLEHTTLRDVREIWIGPFRFEGEATARGRFFVKPHQLVEFGPARLSVRDGRVALGEEVALDALHLELEATLAPVQPGRVRRRELLRLLTGGVKGTLRLRGLESLRPLLPELPARGGAGQVALDLAVGDGLLQPGSWLEAQLRALQLHVGPLQLAGGAALRLRVGPQSATSTLSMPRAVLHLAAVPGLELGGALALETHSPRIDLVSPGHATALLLRVQDLRCDDLTPLSGRLLGVKVEGGQGRADGELRLFTDGREGRGVLHLATGPLALRLRDQSFTAALRADLHLQRFARHPLRGDLRDSALAVTDVQVPVLPHADGFWLTAHLSRAEGALGAQGQAALTLDAEARDGRPLLALLSRSGKLPRVATRLFELPHLTLHAEGQSDAGTLTVSALRLAGGKTELLGALRKLPRRPPRGAFLLRAGPLELGLGTGQGKLALHPVHGDAWFHAQQQTLGAARRPSPRLRR